MEEAEAKALSSESASASGLVSVQAKTRPDLTLTCPDYRHDRQHHRRHGDAAQLAGNAHFASSAQEVWAELCTRLV